MSGPGSTRCTRDTPEAAGAAERGRWSVRAVARYVKSSLPPCCGPPRRRSPPGPCSMSGAAPEGGFESLPTAGSSRPGSTVSMSCPRGSTRRPPGFPGPTSAVGDALALPYGDAAFSLVTCIVVLGSIAGRARVVQALEEGARVLAPGGQLLVYEPRYPNPLNRHTALVPLDVLDEALGAPALRQTLTVIPPLARRLGPLTGRLYPRLAACSPLLSHQLTAYRPGA